MSSLPILLNLIDELDRERYNPLYYGNDFGFGLHPHHIHHQHHHREPQPTNIVGYTLPIGIRGRISDRPSMHRGERGNDKVCAIGKDGFQVCMDVAQFKPSELHVKVLNNQVIVEGNHEEREDEHGYISRQFIRRYTLPQGYDPDKVISTLSSDGVLTVSAPKPQLENKANERVIQIQQTGPAHLNVKENTQEKIGDANGDAEKQK